jgi:integrase
MMLKRRWLAMGRPSVGPVFPDSLGRWRDPKAAGKAIRKVRGDAGYEWLTSHSLGRKTVATLLDEAGVTARKIAGQLGQSRVSITQDHCMKRRSANTEQAAILDRELVV